MTEYTIETNKLCRYFGKLHAVEQVSFQTRGGEIIGLLGANGAGKSTLIKVLTGVLKPTSGEALICGYNVRETPRKVKEQIGYMGQAFLLFENLTVRENILFYGTIYNMPKKQVLARIDELDEKLKIGKYQHRLVSKLPTGWRRALSFAVAMLHEPEIVFLDEPTSGLDVLSRRNLWQMIEQTAQQGKTILVTTHYLDEVSHCSRLLMMNKGVLSETDKNTMMI